MRVILCENYKELSKAAAKIVASQVTLKPNSVLGLATGSTPIGLYDNLVQFNKTGDIDFSGVTTFNLDEYYPISSENNQSYHYFMNKHLFSRININKENTFLLDGETKDPETECENFEKLISQKGGVDLQILGIGRNGHIGFNEPDASLNSYTHLTGLTQSTIDANSRFFKSNEEVPRKALTMGISTILKSKKIIILASGADKSKAVSELLNEEINTDFPATMLKTHPDVTLICDKDAYCGAKLGIDIGGTEVKFAVIDGGEVKYKSKIATASDSAGNLVKAIADEYERIKSLYPIKTVGVGTPGFMKDGLVTAANLVFDKTPLEKMLKEYIKEPICIDNDANCAAIGEAEFGAGVKYDNIIMITLGTGVGGGIVFNKRICHGKNGTGEIGHMIVEARNGRKCGCGQTGCFEQYASVTALIREGEKAAAENKNSFLYKLCKENGGKLNGKLIFDAYKSGCGTAKAVVEDYVDWLAVGIKSLINIFGPDAVVLSGGITADGDIIIGLLKSKINSDVEILISTLKNDAGALGAAML